MLKRIEALRYESAGAADTEHLGELVAPALADGDILVLTGGLGVGKTHFTKGVSRGLGDEHPVTSPTFALMAVHDGGRIPLFHLIYTVLSMLMSWRIPAFLTCWDMRVPAFLNGASSSKTSCATSISRS